MTNKVRNPFIISGYLSAEYFCDRKTESIELTGALQNRRNTVLVSPRRMGKTGLIEHCFHQKEITKAYHTFFIDIYATGSLKEFVFILGKHIFNKLKPKGIKFVEQFFATISSLRPAFKLDPVNGQPVFDIGIGDIRQPLLSIEEIFTYLESADKPCIVAINEFQQITRYPEKNIEAILRTHIQKCRNTSFVFSGSQRHMMQNIFFSASRPFYQSASFMNLEPIAIEPYRKFIHKQFNKADKKISDECITRIYTLLEGHTWYMQVLLNHLYEQADKSKEITVAEANTVLQATVESYRTIYQSMVAMLPERQKEVLFAIAKEGKATEITSTEFIKRHGLNSASSVQSAVKQLLDKEFVTKEGTDYQVYDRFFGLWLSKTYGIGYML
ncbi:ATP-binding protein [Parabacteroides sp. PF5-9]|uniref:AAA family ATPase n=1 Tax=Parabacteroides sp. PF5-9 TaxID=1742404 RepID=UPI002475D521|nr:ATP-binding protein [Parabacteroides sp. PF5-9]MDH6356488.1 AAA+ ATPase superfamily predicted ATPase [Parabacteroides sp. PF5-9]